MNHFVPSYIGHWKILVLWLRSCRCWYSTSQSHVINITTDLIRNSTNWRYLSSFFFFPLNVVLGNKCCYFSWSDRLTLLIFEKMAAVDTSLNNQTLPVVPWNAKPLPWKRWLGQLAAWAVEQVSLLPALFTLLYAAGTLCRLPVTLNTTKTCVQAQDGMKLVGCVAVRVWWAGYS